MKTRPCSAKATASWGQARRWPPTEAPRTTTISASSTRLTASSMGRPIDEFPSPMYWELQTRSHAQPGYGLGPSPGSRSHLAPALNVLEALEFKSNAEAGALKFQEISRARSWTNCEKAKPDRSICPSLRWVWTTIGFHLLNSQ